jgi:GrpB-like predicted nucleotidyltransferase (UPF0157 family)
LVDADTVVLVPYDEAWPSLFVEERVRIERALGSWVEAIEHVGSTAVPGLTAKPILDIMVGVSSLRDAKRCIGPLEQLGYEYRGEAGVPGRLFFRKGNPKTHHLHVTEIGSEFWERHPVFRDYLRAHPETARNYALPSTTSPTASAEIAQRTPKLRQASSRRSSDVRGRTSAINFREFTFSNAM